MDPGITYRLQVQAVNAHERSKWSYPAFVHPSDYSPRMFYVFFPEVADHPLSSYRPKNDDGLHEFSFRICSGTRPDGVNLLSSEVAVAVNRWQSAIKKDSSNGRLLKTTWTTDDVDSETCQPPVVNEGPTRFEGYNSILFATDLSMEDAQCTVEGIAYRACWRSWSQWWIAADGSSGELDCLPEMEDGTILLREALTMGGDPARWNDLAYEGQCKLSQHTITHEVGHAFGIGITTVDYCEVHPETQELSIMSAGWGHYDDYCRPQAYDIVALMANYQSR